jgi:hypothetical protein
VPGPILKCPHCGDETRRAAAFLPDETMRCTRCGTRSEYRQLHEAWCAGHRAELLRACPDLTPSYDSDILTRLRERD